MQVNNTLDTLLFTISRHFRDRHIIKCWGLRKIRVANFGVAPTQANIIEFSNFFLQLKNQRCGSKTVCGVSIFILKLWRFRVKESVLFVEISINFNKNETESKMENPTYSSREKKLEFQIIFKNWEFKLNLWWFGTCERKKGKFFVTFILSEGNFFNVCVLSQCIE